MSTIVRGSEADRLAWVWATKNQGYDGTYADWLIMSLSERKSYEDGAACGDTAIEVVEAGS